MSQPIQRYLLEKLLKATVHFPSRLGLSTKTLRHLMALSVKIFPIDRSLQFTSLTIAGLSCEEIKPQHHQSEQTIFHIHGGAFFLGGLYSHRGFMCDLVNYTQAQVLHIDYPLAPEHQFPTALNSIYMAYLELLDQGIDPNNITISGDSCGGNLALALCLKIRDEKQALPKGLILMSPWLDLSLSGDSMQYNRNNDSLLSKDTLVQGIKYYLSEDTCIDEPYVSPLFANLNGLPKILIQVGSKEILFDDSKRFKQYADQAGIDATLSIFPEMWHNFHMFSLFINQAKQALGEVAEFVNRTND